MTTPKALVGPAPVGSAMATFWQSRPLNVARSVLRHCHEYRSGHVSVLQFSLDCHRRVSISFAETAELLASELVTKAVRFSGDPARAAGYSGR